MIIHMCDAHECPQRAVFTVLYQKGQHPVEVCGDHLAWPTSLSLDNWADESGFVTLIVKRVS